MMAIAIISVSNVLNFKQAKILRIKNEIDHHNLLTKSLQFKHKHCSKHRPKILKWKVDEVK